MRILFMAKDFYPPKRGAEISNLTFFLKRLSRDGFDTILFV